MRASSGRCLSHESAGFAGGSKPPSGFGICGAGSARRAALDFAGDCSHLETMNRAADIIRFLNRVCPIAGS